MGSRHTPCPLPIEYVIVNHGLSIFCRLFPARIAMVLLFGYNKDIWKDGRHSDGGPSGRFPLCAGKDIEMTKAPEKVQKPSISLRKVQIFMMVIALSISGALLYFTFISYSTSQQLSKATDEYISLQNAANGLMEASDYLTEMAQRFTEKGDRAYMDAYFEEVFTTKRRERAISVMHGHLENAAALEELQSALDESVSLMEREYYAMKLVVEARGYTDIPEAVQAVTLKPEHAALSPSEKMDLAQSMLLDETYYSQKNRIRGNIQRSQQALITATRDQKTRVADRLNRDMVIERVIILIQTVMFLLMMWITMRLGIDPVLKAVKSIQTDSRIPLVGASEFRYLAHAYNKMYEYYHVSIQRLNYKASHDALTQLYNRAGYELLLSGVDLATTYFLLIDVDNFKTVNDTMGHEVGDRVIKKVAAAIKGQFRQDDYVCRIGGDEFAVLMTHAEPGHRALVSGKLDRINQALADTSDGLPAVSISAGVTHGSQMSTAMDLFAQADQVLYETKRKGRHGYTFYNGNYPVLNDR